MHNILEITLIKNFLDETEVREGMTRKNHIGQSFRFYQRAGAIPTQGYDRGPDPLGTAVRVHHLLLCEFPGFIILVAKKIPSVCSSFTYVNTFTLISIQSF